MIEQLRLLGPLSWRSLWRNPRRTVITMIVVCVGVWSIATFSIMLRAWSQSSRDTTTQLLVGTGQIHAKGYLDDPSIVHRMPPPDTKLIDALHGTGIHGYASRVRVGAVARSEYKTLPITFVGVRPSDERGISELPNQIVDGRYLNGPDDSGIVIGRNLAKRLKTRVGKRIVVMTQNTAGALAERAFPVVGIYSAPQNVEDEFAFAGIDVAQSFTRIGPDISEIAFQVPEGAPLDQAIESLRRAAPTLDVQSWHTLAPLAYAMGTFFDQFISMWLGVMFVLMAIGIVNTQLMAVFERTREFGLLHALGMRSHTVLFEVALESALLIALGVLAGVLLAVLTVLPFRDGLNLGFLGRGAELIGAGRILYPRVDAMDLLLYGSLVWILGLAVTLWPARRAARIGPVEAMRRT